MACKELVVIQLLTIITDCTLAVLKLAFHAGDLLLKDEYSVVFLLFAECALLGNAIRQLHGGAGVSCLASQLQFYGLLDGLLDGLCHVFESQG